MNEPGTDHEFYQKVVSDAAAFMRTLIPIDNLTSYTTYVSQSVEVAEGHLVAAKHLARTHPPLTDVASTVHRSCIELRDHLDQVMSWVAAGNNLLLSTENPGITGAVVVFSALCNVLSAMMIFGDYDDLLAATALDFDCGPALAVSSLQFKDYTMATLLEAWHAVRDLEFDVPRLCATDDLENPSQDTPPSPYESFVAYQEALLVTTALLAVTTTDFDDPFPRHDTAPLETSFHYTRHVDVKDEAASIAGGEYVAKTLLIAGERFLGECASDAYVACRPWLGPALRMHAFRARLEAYPTHIVAAALRGTCVGKPFPSMYESTGEGVDDRGDMELVNFALSGLPAILMGYASSVPGMRPIVTSVANHANCAPKYRIPLLCATFRLSEVSGQEAVDTFAGVGERFLFHQVLPGRTLSSAYSDHSMHNLPEGRMVYRAHLWNILLNRCEANLDPVGNAFFMIGADNRLRSRYVPPATPLRDGSGFRVPSASTEGFDAAIPAFWESETRVKPDRAEIHALSADVILVECMGVSYRCIDLDSAFLLWLCIVWSSSLSGVLRVPIKNGEKITSYNEVNISGALETISTELRSRAYCARAATK